MTPDLDIVITFATALRRRGPWTFVAKHPDRVQMTRDEAKRKGLKLDTTKQAMPVETFTPNHFEAMAEWINKWNTTHGIYFESNPVRPQAFHRRASQYLRDDAKLLDVWAFQYIAGDFDPPPFEGFTPDSWEKHVRQRLAECEPKPTLIWRSGYGMQCAWRVKPAFVLNTNEDVRRCRDVARGMLERVVKQTKLGCDSVGSIEHLFRLPGTVNWPDVGKRTIGRVPVLAGSFTFDPEAVYPLTAFPKPTPKPRPVRYGLNEPPGGWDHDENIPYAVLHCQHTNDLAAEGKSGTGIRTALVLRDWGMSEEMALDIMWRVWVPRCEYVWDENELKSKITTAYRLAENDPGCKTPLYRNAKARHRLEEARKEFSND